MPTLAQKIYNSKKDSQRGFTLIEVMIVLTIIAFAATLIATRIDNRNTQLKSFVRKFTVMTKRIRNEARVKNVTLRIVFDMGEGLEDRPHRFWVEKAEGAVPLKVDDRGEIEAPELIEDEKGNLLPNDGFEIDTDILDGVQKLPEILAFSSIEVSSFPRALEEGRAYIHFLPQGLVEESAIHIYLDERLQWTLAVHPITGKTEIIPRYLSLKDIKDQK